jgi:hypothetical protein
MSAHGVRVHRAQGALWRSAWLRAKGWGAWQPISQPWRYDLSQSHKINLPWSSMIMRCQLCPQDLQAKRVKVFAKFAMILFSSISIQ